MEMPDKMIQPGAKEEAIYLEKLIQRGQNGTGTTKVSQT